jgi:hypothetical protein
MAKFNTLRFVIKNEVLGQVYPAQTPLPMLRDCATSPRKETGAPYFNMSAVGATKKSNTLATISMIARNTKICLLLIEPPK